MKDVLYGWRCHISDMSVNGCCRNQHLDGRKAAKEAIAEAHAAGGKICAFYCESVLSCGGQVNFNFSH